VERGGRRRREAWGRVSRGLSPAIDLILHSRLDPAHVRFLPFVDAGQVENSVVSGRRRREGNTDKGNRS
jgi:hypothetical protein